MPDRISSSHGRVSFEEWRLTHPPMAGGAPEGDAGDGGGDGDAGGTEATATPAAGADTGKQGGDDENVTLSKREVEQLNARLKEAETRARKLQRDQEGASRKAMEEAGEFERLWKAEQEAHASTRQLIATKAKENTILAVAQRLHYRDPALAVSLIDRDVPTADVVDEDFEVNERAIERALTKLADRAEYLVDRPQGQAGEAGAGERRNGRAAEAERNAVDDYEVIGGRSTRKLNPQELLTAHHKKNPPTRR